MSTITTCNDLREAALWYAQHGFRVFPVAPRDKAPLLPGHGYHDATDDVAQVRDWWAEYPNANIGLACDANDLLVLDVDTHEADGFATLAELCGDHELVTPTADTGGGGRHLLFTLPDYETRGTAGPGLDVKRPGYIVAPPSIHSSGRAYRWRYGSAPGEVPIAPVPDWLETAIRRADYVPPPEPVDDYRAIAARAGKHDAAQVAIEALRYLPPGAVDDYDAWLAVGMALHAAGCDCSEWDTWSRQSPRWREGVCQAKWRGFTAGGGRRVGVGTLVEMARETEPNFLRPGWRSRQAPRRANAATAAQVDPGGGADDAAGAEYLSASHVEPGRYTCTDDGNADRFKALCGHRFAYCHDWSTWLVYDGSRWAVDTDERAVAAACMVATSILREAADEPDDKVRREVAKHALQSLRRQQLESMLVLARHKVPIGEDLLDADPWLLNCLNGTVDLRTGRLRPHDPADRITRITNAAYVPDADLADTPGARDWRAFRETVTGGDDDLEAYLQRAAGYSMTGDPREEVLFFAYGPTRTGKSTFLETLRHVAHDYGETIDFSAFLHKRDDSSLRPGLHRLRGKRIATSSETTAGRAMAEGLLKSITGGDNIESRTLYSKSATWKPAFTLWLAANDRPNVRHDDEATWVRIKVAPFVCQVAPGQIDTGLKRRLRETAGEAVLAWLVRGCREWQARGLGTCAAVEAAVAEYKEAMDPLAGWLEDRCAVDAERRDWFSPTVALYGDYRTWCTEAGETQSQLSKDKFTKSLTKRGLVAERRYLSRRQTRGFRGIRLTAQATLELDDDPDPEAE